jgi:uncharacterized RDD family membrane protein YckC
VGDPAAIVMTIATKSERIMASLIDGLIFLPILFLDRSIGQMTQSQVVIFLYFLVSWQLGWPYSTLLHGYRGQTLGKMHKKIQVVRVTNGSGISYGRAALRDLPIIALMIAGTLIWVYANIAWFGGWYSEQHDAIVQKVYWLIACCNVGWVLLECVSMLVHPQRRAIHDLIAGTIVVQKPAISKETRLQVNSPDVSA